MPELFTESVRFDAALGVAMLGSGLVLAGLATGPTGWRRRPWAARALIYLYAFRRVVVGLAMVAAAIGWLAHLPWLLGAAVCIGLGELLESSYYIGVLRWQERRRA